MELMQTLNDDLHILLQLLELTFEHSPALILMKTSLDGLMVNYTFSGEKMEHEQAWNIVK
jgi:hypothetical protein